MTRWKAFIGISIISTIFLTVTFVISSVNGHARDIPVLLGIAVAFIAGLIFLFVKADRHKSLKVISVLLLPFSILIIVSCGIYLVERSNVSWNTGEVIIGDQTITLPCKVRDFSEKTGWVPDIEEGKVYKGDIVTVHWDESKSLNLNISAIPMIKLFIEEDQVTGIIVGYEDYWEKGDGSVIREYVKFPGDIDGEDDYDDIFERYSTGLINVFVSDWSEELDSGITNHGCDFRFENHHLSLDAHDNEVTGIYYYVGR